MCGVPACFAGRVRVGAILRPCCQALRDGHAARLRMMATTLVLKFVFFPSYQACWKRLVWLMLIVVMEKKQPFVPSMCFISHSGKWDKAS